MARYVVLDTEKLKLIHWDNGDATQTFTVRVMKTVRWWKRIFGVKALAADIRVLFVGEWRFNGNVHDYPHFRLNYMHNGEMITEPSVHCDIHDVIRNAWREMHKWIEPNPWAPVALDSRPTKLPAMKLLKR